MAQNVIFVSPKPLDEATILDAPNFLAAAPASAAHTFQTKKTAQSDGLSNIYVEYDLLSAMALDSFAAVNPNFTGAATWRWRGATSQANLTAAPGYDSTSVSVWPASGKPTDEDWEQHTCMLLSNNTTAYRYWRVDFADAGNPESMIEYGRLVGGIRWQPSINFTFDWGMRFESADVQDETPYGQTQTNERLRPRGWMLPFDSVRRADVFANAATLQRMRGRAGQILCCLDYSEDEELHWHTMFGVLKELGEIGQKFANIYTARFQLRETV